MAVTNLDLAAYLGISPVLLGIIMVWSLAWMGIALWKSAKKNHLIWFVVFLLVHTLGILEILYIFVFSKMSAKSTAQVPIARKKRR